MALLAAMGLPVACGSKGEEEIAMAAPGRPKSGAAKPASRPTSRPVVRAWQPRPYPTDEVNLIVFGDWGSDNKPQRQVAESMAQYVEKVGTQFHGVLSLGDNLYMKLSGVQDYQWQTMFEDMYDAKRINMPFYSVLGNHDYEQNKPAIQLAYATQNPTSRWKMPSKYYRLDLPTGKPIASVLMLDSNRHKFKPDEWARQTAWLRAELAKPRPAWLIVTAHHPLFSNGLHGDNGLLQREWVPLFEQYKVDLYACGHEHNLQHLELLKLHTSFVVTGAGGRDFSPMVRARGPFARQLYGFVHLRLLPDQLTARYINAKDGKEIHVFTRDLAGKRTVTFTTPNDKLKVAKRQKPFDETDKVTPVVPSMDPEPTPPATQPAAKPPAKAKAPAKVPAKAP